MFTAPLCPLLARVYSPDRNEQDHEKGEDHLHVGQRVHPKGTQDDKLDHLQPREVVHLPLRYAPDVVRGRVGRLDTQEDNVAKSQL